MRNSCTADGYLNRHGAALREPLRWRDSRLDHVPLVHVTPGLNAIRVPGQWVRHCSAIVPALCLLSGDTTMRPFDVLRPKEVR